MYAFLQAEIQQNPTLQRGVHTSERVHDWYVKIFYVKSNMQQQATVSHKKSNMGENNGGTQF
jgi:hypothetical protein